MAPGGGLAGGPRSMPKHTRAQPRSPKEALNSVNIDERKFADGEESI